MKKVLVVAHPFPPSAGGGVQRTLKFVKYLPHYNWQPVVLTVSKEVYPHRDESLLADIPPQARVYRTFSLEPTFKTIKAVHETWKATGKNKASLKRRVVTWLRHRLPISDYSIGWLPSALYEGWKICHRDRVQVIYVTGNPFSSFLIAYGLSLLSGKPFVVDFRDAWTLDPYTEWLSEFRRNMERWQERKVLTKAVAAIFATEPLRQDYANAYPQLARKFVTVVNGFDEEDFTDAEPITFSRFTLTYVGKFIGYRRPDFFLKAFKDLVVEDDSFRNEAQVVFVGHVGKRNEELIRDWGLEHHVKAVGYVPHGQALAYMKGADVLLLIGTGDVTEGTGKVFEYLMAGRPIIASVAPQAAVAQTIRETKTGLVVPTQDVDAIKAAVKLAYQSYKEGRSLIVPEGEVVKRYSRKQLTGELARILDKVAGDS